MNAPVAFVDLDRTLIYSRRAFGMAADEPPEVVCVEHYDGGPLSFVTQAAAALIGALTTAGRLVPVTTRTVAQLARVRLPGPAPVFAVSTNGAHILRDGVPDQGWAGHVRDTVGASAAPLAEVQDHMAGVLSEEWTLSRRVADDIFCYAVVDRAAMPDGVVSELAGWAGERGWTVSVQGRKVYAVPASLDKAAAAAEVARRLGAGRTLAAGDSLLDRSLLSWADEAIRPRHGELAATDWLAPHLTVTAGHGVLAGQEIASWLTARMAAATEWAGTGRP